MSSTSGPGGACALNAARHLPIIPGEGWWVQRQTEIIAPGKRKSAQNGIAVIRKVARIGIPLTPPEPLPHGVT
jgi:hypothetical protein